MNNELIRQCRALVNEENRHNAKAIAAFQAIQPGRRRVVDRKLLRIAERELLQAEFCEILQNSPAYRVNEE